MNIRNNEDRRIIDARRISVDRRSTMSTVAQNHRSSPERRETRTRRIYLDRRITATSFRDIT